MREITFLFTFLLSCRILKSQATTKKILFFLDNFFLKRNVYFTSCGVLPVSKFQLYRSYGGIRYKFSDFLSFHFVIDAKQMRNRYNILVKYAYAKFSLGDLAFFYDNQIFTYGVHRTWIPKINTYKPLNLSYHNFQIMFS